MHHSISSKTSNLPSSQSRLPEMQMAQWRLGSGRWLPESAPNPYPIKGNGTSHIYHLPGQASYAATIAELCFSTEEDAIENGYRPTKRNRPSS